MTTTASESFLDYNMGKLEVRSGLVHLLPAGWAEYGPTFSAAGLMLRDRMPLDEFKRAVRHANRTALEDNNRALREQLADLSTPVAEKQLIRAVLNPAGDVRAESTESVAQVIQFPSRREGSV